MATQVSQVRESVRDHGGEVLDVGYVSSGDRTKALVEARITHEGAVHVADQLAVKVNPWTETRRMFEFRVSEGR